MASLPRRGALQLRDDAESEPQLRVSPDAYCPRQMFPRFPPPLDFCYVIDNRSLHDC